MEELWDIARVAEYLGVSERTVYNRVRAGELPATKVGRLWRVKPSELSSWLAGDAARDAAERERPALAADVPGPYPFDSATEPPLVAAESGPMPTRADLERLLAPLVPVLERRIAFVGLLTKAVGCLGWPPPIVVGGHALEYYTAGDYPTIDIDLAGASEPVGQVLEEWDFAREGRHWYDEALHLVVEIPGSRPSTEELAHVIAVHSGSVTTYVLGIEDLIVDRLCAAVHWSDVDAAMWAGTVLAEARELDEDYLCRRAREEDVLEALDRMRGADAT